VDMRLRALLAVVIVSLILPGTVWATATAPQPVAVGRVLALRDILLRDDAAVVRAVFGDYRIVNLPDGNFGLAPLPPEEKKAIPADMIPQSAIATGVLDIKAAWLAGPTGRYEHGVLGDAIEAAALKVETETGRILSYELPEESVFEDLIPRLVDLDGDARDEILVVRSTAGSGAAVVVLGIREDRLRLIAESPSIGRSRRWLNPLGAGDFDDDGSLEIAVVQTPHLGGVLVVYRLEGMRLVETVRKSGFSTHVIGSTALRMAAVVDLDGDGVDDILLPDRSRSELYGMGYAGRKLQVLWTVPNQHKIVTSVVLVDVNRNGRPDVLYGLNDGSVWMLQR